MDINNNLHHGIKIGERGGQVIATMKGAIFCHVWHSYMIVHAIIDKLMCIKVVDLSLVSGTMKIS